MVYKEEVGAFLTAIRNVESGSSDGNYHLRTPTTVGAYQFMQSQWEAMSGLAGMQGANVGDRFAQDAVATYWADRWHKRYGDWGLVAVAWGGGQDSADRVARRGFESSSVIRNENLRLYTEQVQAQQQKAMSKGQTGLPPGAERMIVEYGGPQGQWLNPVAGQTEYSNSFRVPRSNKLGIHGAIDVYAKAGTPIVSPITGKVMSAKTGGKGGHTVTVMGTDGIKYYFAHMESEARVQRGDQVNAGTHLGYVGASGNAAGTSPHLHFSMRDNKNRVINPYNYLKGSVEGGGAFRAISPETVRTDMKRSFGKLTEAAMETTSNSIAGGTRVDPRTLAPTDEDPQTYGDEYGNTSAPATIERQKEKGFFNRKNKPLERGQ